MEAFVAAAAEPAHRDDSLGVRMKTKITFWMSRVLLVAVTSGLLASCASTGGYSANPPPVRHTVGPAGLRMMPLYPPLPT
jgi:hypothetical protein